MQVSKNIKVTDIKIDTIPKYQLLKEPWIRVLYNDLTEEKLSLTDVFKEASRIRKLCGESSQQDVAIFRLLLAILITVIYRYNVDGTAEPIEDIEGALLRWKEYHDEGEFPEILYKYLESQKNRFYLFHPEAPFYQTPGILDANHYTGDFNRDTADDLCKFAHTMNTIQDSKNPGTKPLFSVKGGIHLDVTPYDEAARWLIYHQAYTKSMKKPLQNQRIVYIDNGDGNAKKTRLGNECHLKASVPPGPAGKGSIIMAETGNLFEDLMLNACLTNRDSIWSDPQPIWEQPVSDTYGREITADNMPALYTLQSRRLILIDSPEEHAVRYFYEYVGDVCDISIAEPMMSWRSDGKTTLPVSCHAELWRELPVIIATTQNEAKGKKKAKYTYQKARLFSWLEKLEENGLVNASASVIMHIVGQNYGNCSLSYESAYEDTLTMSAGLICTLNGSPWLRRIQDEVEKMSGSGLSVRSRLRSLGNQLKIGDKSNLPDLLQDAFFSEVDAEFRNRLMLIDISDTSEAAMNAFTKSWQEAARSAALHAISICIKEIGSLLWNPVKNSEPIKHINEAKRAIWTIYPADNTAVKGADA